MDTPWAIVGTIAGVIVGGIGTYLIESLITRREEVLAARLELPPIRSMIWDENPLRLREQVGLIRARTSLLGVDSSVVDELEYAASDCYDEWYSNREFFGTEAEVISKEKLARLDAAIDAADAAILRARRKARGRKRALTP